MKNWSIESSSGQPMSEGIQTESEARRIAQEHADRLGETVYLYGPGVDGEAVDPDVE